jgi:glycosyltransferase involved in cell wall biosynthesis
MSAARRPEGLTKHLERLGHRVTVLTSVMCGSGPVPGAAQTIRTRDLLVSPLNWRRASFAALKGETTGVYAPRPSSLSAWVIPDLEIVGWTPFALSRARELIKQERFDCVITSSPPQSGHLIGLALQSHGIPWVADFRDGWTFERADRPPSAIRPLDGLDRRLERGVVRRADAVCAVTDPIATDLADRFGRPVATITNGFDPDRPTSPAERLDGLLSPRRRSLVHTGNLASGGRSLDLLLSAVKKLAATAPVAAQQLEIVLVGPTTVAEQDAVVRAGSTDSVRLTGPVPRTTALALQRAADGLLVITGSGQSGVATGKLYEYLAAERPILVIGEDTAAAEIVQRVAAGIAVPRDDPDAVAAALRQFVEVPDQLPRPRPEALAAYAYPRLAAEMSELVEVAIARHIGRR